MIFLKAFVLLCVFTSAIFSASAQELSGGSLSGLSKPSTPPVETSMKEQTINSEPQTEPWSFQAQATYVLQQKNNFYSPYSGANSLLNSSQSSNANTSYTFSSTAYLATRLWPGAEVHYNPEVFQGTPYSGGLIGLGGFQNGELQKGMFIPYIYYNARTFIAQTIGLGGGEEHLDGSIDSHLLAGFVDKNRVVINYGKMASLDFFDKNKYSHEPRNQFLNFAIFSMAAYGYAADTKGFTYGLVGEWYQGDWILKGGRLAVPTIPNENVLDYTLKKDYVDQVELTHNHNVLGQPGAIRALLFQQHAYMATYQDAVSQYQATPGMQAPNILMARNGYQNKHGYGVNAEQAISEDLGLFARWSWNDGRTETQTLDVSSSISGGFVVKGTPWRRPQDTIGVGFASNKIAPQEVNYLQLGGMTMFIGDSALSYKPEQVMEVYYSAELAKAFFVTLDFQRITNPAYNTDRGPINVMGLRLHYEI